ncbi:putative gustatory receptor 98b [Cochliomyia hominivorax]
MNAYLNSSILLKELKIYQWIFTFFGFNFPPVLLYRSQRDNKYLIMLTVYILYSLLLLAASLWAAHKHNYIVSNATFRHQLDSMTEIITYLQNCGIAGLQIVFLYKSCCQHKKLLDICFLIKKLEDNLIRPKRPIMFKQQRLRQRLFFSSGLFLVTFIAFSFYLNYYLIANDLNWKAKLLVICFLITIQMKFIENAIYIQLIHEYLELLWVSLECLKMKLENEEQRTKPLAGYYSKALRHNQETLMEIWYLVYKLQQYFSWPIFVLFFFNGIHILCTVSWAYVQYVYETRSVYQIFRLVYVLILLLNILLLCNLSQKCLNKYQQFSHILLSLKLYPQDVEMITGVKEYSLLLMHQRLEFTCSGYLDINLKYFGKTILVILAYAVIIIQFKLTDVNEGVLKATKIILGHH